jgi:chemotaxis protein methyltransferase CheR
VPPSIRARYFSRSGDRYEVAPHLREMVSFAELNLVEDGYPSPLTGTVSMDLVLCRNVLLYFDPATARSVVGRLRAALAGDGWLLVSQVEAILGPFAGLEAALPAAAAYRKAGSPAEAAPARWPEGAGPPQPPPRPPRAERRLPPARPSPGPLVEPAPATPDGAPGPAEGAAACQEALHLWRSGRPQDALRRLDQAVGRDPLAPAAHYLAGLVQLDQGLGDEALASFRRCTYADPGFILGHLATAGQLARAGLRERARASLLNALRLASTLDPDDPVPHGDGLTVRELLSLASAHRALLGPDAALEVLRG